MQSFLLSQHNNIGIRHTSTANVYLDSALEVITQILDNVRPRKQFVDPIGNFGKTCTRGSKTRSRYNPGHIINNVKNKHEK